MPRSSSRPRIASRSPFADWPEGLPFAGGMVWFLPEAILCVQTYASRIDRSIAASYVATIRAVRDVEQASIARAGGLRIYQDLRSVQIVDRDARAYLTEAARSDLGRWSLVCNKIELPPHNPIVRVTIQLVAMVAHQMGLPAFDLSADLTRELARDGVHAPEGGPVFTARHAAYDRMRDAARAG